MKKITIFTLYSYLQDNLYKTKKTEKVHLWLVAQARCAQSDKKRGSRMKKRLRVLFLCCLSWEKTKPYCCLNTVFKIVPILGGVP